MEAASLEKLNERKNVATDLPLDVEVSEKVGCRMPVRMYSRSNMNIWGTHCMDRERKEIDQFYRVGSFCSIKKKKSATKLAASILNKPLFPSNGLTPKCPWDQSLYFTCNLYAPGLGKKNIDWYKTLPH